MFKHRENQHTFHFLAQSNADCFIGFEFLEGNQCGLFFSGKKIRLNSEAFSLYIEEYLQSILTKSLESPLHWQRLDPSQSLDDHNNSQPVMLAPTNRVGFCSRAVWTLEHWQECQSWPCFVQIRKGNVFADFKKCSWWNGNDFSKKYVGTIWNGRNRENQNIQLKFRKTSKVTDKKGAKYDLKQV